MKNFLFVCLFVSGFAFAQKKYPSLLWKVSKGGKSCGYLYGTMHVSNKSAFRFSDAMLDALEKCNYVAFETDPAVWLPGLVKIGEQNKELTVYSYSGNQQSFYTSLFSIPFPNNYTYISALQFEPDIINGLLYRNESERKNFQEATYVDLFIYQTAVKKNKKIISLEDFESSEIYSRLSQLPDSEFDTIPEQYSEYEYENKIEELYRDGNLEALDSLVRRTETKNYVRFLLEERNKFFFKNLDSVFQSGAMVFAAVGAAHLAGPNGLIEELRKAGYIVEAIIAPHSEKTMQKVTSVMQQMYPVRLQSFSVLDSTLNIKAPGPFYPVFTYDDMSCMVSPDIVNGNYVSVLRIKTYGAHLNISQEQLFKKIDSLIYEGIGGKIYRKDIIPMQQGFSGYDILSRLNDGNILHTKILIHPYWIYIVKIRCNENYYNQFGKAIMESVRCSIRKSTQAWFSPSTGFFKIQQRDFTSYFRNIRSISQGLFEVYETCGNSGNTVTGFMRGRYPSVTSPEIDSLELRKLYYHIRETFSADDTSGIFKVIKENGSDVAEFYFRMKYRNYIKGWIWKSDVSYNFLYVISADMKQLTIRKEEIFQRIPVRYQYSFEKITDRDFFFTTVDELSHSAEENFSKKYMSYYNRYKSESPAFLRQKNKPVQYEIQDKMYYSPSSMHGINIIMEQYPPYESYTFEEFKKQLLNLYSRNYSCKIRILQYDTVTFKPFIHFCLSDTATTEQLHFRVYVKYNRVYQLKYLKDSLSETDAWMEAFIKNFEPMDTLPGPYFFKDKIENLVKDLLSSDTLISGSASRTFQNDIVFKNSQTDSWLRIVQSSEFDKLSTLNKALFILRSNNLDSRKIIPILSAMYRKWADSSYLQLTILKTLASMKNSDAIKSMQVLINEEIPVTGLKSYAVEIFLPLLDSLPLAKQIFPTLLRLSDAEEYRNICISMMALLLEKEMLRPQEYASLVDKLLLQGKIELKKYIATGYLNNIHFTTFLRQKNFDEKSVQYINDLLDEFYQPRTSLYQSEILQKKLISRESFLNYFILLAPYYSKHAGVKEWIHKVMKIQSFNTYIPMMLWALKYKIIQKDSIQDLLFGNHIMKFYVYFLSHEYKLNIFTNNPVSETQWMKNFVLAHIKKEASYVYESYSQKDSLQFHKAIPVSFKNHKGNLYLFKSSFAISQGYSGFVQES